MTPTPYLPPVMSDVVCDISHYENVSQDFALTAKGGIAAVILKATQGLWTDQTFLPRVAEARDAGLLVGAYLFLDASATPAEQAAYFLTVAKSEGGCDWLAVDWEPYAQSQANITTAATAVASIQAATGRWPVLYTIRYMLSAPNKTLSNCPLWLAEYGNRPICPPGFTAWKLWQHTDGTVGSNVVPVPGIGRCDRSKFAGTLDQLKAWWANPTEFTRLRAAPVVWR